MINPAVSRFPLLPRKKNTDKSHYGHVLVLAGSRGMTGAAVLAGQAALRSGSGLVTIGIPKSLENTVAKKSSPEIMRLGLPETKQGTLSFSALAKVLSCIQKRKINCLAVGPGLSTEPQTAKLVRSIVCDSPVPVVLDADGLNSFKSKIKFLRKHRASLVLTPHRREFERLFDEKWPERKDARIRLAKKLSKFYDVVLVLKSSGTLVVSRDNVYVNKTGNPGMAKGGSGDVLTGVIAALIAQGLDLFRASVWGVYFHGKAGDLAVKSNGELGLIASDLIECLPRVF